MKTIIKNKIYKRVDDITAENEVKFHGAKYVSKSEWKNKVRDIKKETN